MFIYDYICTCTHHELSFAAMNKDSDNLLNKDSNDLTILKYTKNTCVLRNELGALSCTSAPSRHCLVLSVKKNMCFFDPLVIQSSGPCGASAYKGPCGREVFVFLFLFLLVIFSVS